MKMWHTSLNKEIQSL